LRGDVNLQTEADEMLGLPEDQACEFEMVVTVRRRSLLTAWRCVHKRPRQCGQQNAAPTPRDRSRRHCAVQPVT
jgi:hypothetical protein